MGFFGPAKKKVLIVDDDENVLSMLEMALSTAGYDVDTAPDGNVCLKKLTTKRYDLAILDQNMPGATGMKVLETVSGSAISKETKFIMLTAESQVGLIDRAYSYKALHYIVKPFDVSRLLAKVKEILDK